MSGNIEFFHMIKLLTHLGKENTFNVCRFSSVCQFTSIFDNARLQTTKFNIAMTDVINLMRIWLKLHTPKALIKTYTVYRSVPLLNFFDIKSNKMDKAVIPDYIFSTLVLKIEPREE